MTKGDCKVVAYTSRHLDGVLALLGAWRRRTWAWQYTPESARCSIVAEDESGNVVGFNGAIPATLSVRGEAIDAIWSCDFIVDPRWQRRGVGSAMKRYLQGSHSLIMALGISEAGAATHNRTGWTATPGVPHFSFQLSVRTAKDAAKRAIQVANRLFGAALRPLPPGVEVTISPASLLPDEAGLLWLENEPMYGAAVRRDTSYLNWRYATHPSASYQLILVRREGRLAALGVFRRGPGRSTLVDYVGPANDDGLKFVVVDRFIHECRGADRLTCVTSDPGLRRALQLHGFRAWSHQPLRFNVYSAPYLRSPIGPWFLMGGDSDGDFLAAARAMG